MESQTVTFALKKIMCEKILAGLYLFEWTTQKWQNVTKILSKK